MLAARLYIDASAPVLGGVTRLDVAFASSQSFLFTNLFINPARRRQIIREQVHVCEPHLMEDFRATITRRSHFWFRVAAGRRDGSGRSGRCGFQEISALGDVASPGRLVPL